MIEDTEVLSDLETEMRASLDSWEMRIDDPLGMARTVLDAAITKFIAGTLTDDGAEAASTLAEACRDLADAWEVRQSHCLRITREIDGDDTEEEEEVEEDETVEADA